MPTDPVDGIGGITLNGFDMCITSWNAKEEATETDTTSSCDGDGDSSDMSNFKLVVDFEAFYSKSRPYHNPAQHNLQLDSVVDLAAYLGDPAGDDKYTITDGKVTAWQTSSKIKDKVKVTGTVRSQGPRTSYTLPTTAIT